MDFRTAQKKETVISSVMQETNSSIQSYGDLIGEFNIAEGNITKASNDFIEYILDAHQMLMDFFG